jgi:hypothetical protein
MPPPPPWRAAKAKDANSKPKAQSSTLKEKSATRSPTLDWGAFRRLSSFGLELPFDL